MIRTRRTTHAQQSVVVVTSSLIQCYSAAMMLRCVSVCLCFVLCVFVSLSLLLLCWQHHSIVALLLLYYYITYYCII